MSVTRERVEVLEGRLISFEQNVNNRFEAQERNINARFEAQDQRFEVQDKKLDDILMLLRDRRGIMLHWLSTAG